MNEGIRRCVRELEQEIDELKAVEEAAERVVDARHYELLDALRDLTSAVKARRESAQERTP